MYILYVFQCIMNVFFHELENLFSEHFESTPINTPAVSQVSDHEDMSDDEAPADEVVNLDQCAI